MRGTGEAEVAKSVPGGVRTERPSQRRALKISGFRAAGVSTAGLADHVDEIITILGLDYLRPLKSLKGADDGYVDWAASPIDAYSLRHASPRDGQVLAAFEKACEAARNIEDDWDSDCMALKRAKTDGGIFYTFGNGRIVFIDPKRGLLHIAYTGPTNGVRVQR